MPQVLFYNAAISSLVQEGADGHHWDTQRLQTNDLCLGLRNEGGRQDKREKECGWSLSADIAQRVWMG